MQVAVAHYDANNMDDMAKFYEGKIKNVMTNKKIKTFIDDKSKGGASKIYNKQEELDKLKKKG